MDRIANAVLAVCPNCNSVFEATVKSGKLSDPLGPYCSKKECQEKNADECSALFDMELSYAAKFVLEHDMLDIISTSPARAKQIIKLLHETESWYPDRLSKEAASNWRFLNEKFLVFPITK